MSEIELLGEQIESMRTLFPLYFAFMFGGLVGALVSLTFEWQMKLGIAVGLGFMITGAILLLMLNADISPLIDERDRLIDQEISSMSCDELRWNVINIIEGIEHVPERLGENLEKKKDIYYYKCELPLRDEVLKLQ